MNLMIFVSDLDVRTFVLDPLRLLSRLIDNSERLVDFIDSPLKMCLIAASVKELLPNSIERDLEILNKLKYSFIFTAPFDLKKPMMPPPSPIDWLLNLS